MEKLLRQFSVKDDFGDRHSISISLFEEEKYLIVRDSVRNSSNEQVLSIDYRLEKWRTRQIIRVLSLTLNKDALKETWNRNIDNGNITWSYELDKEVLSLASSIGATVWQGFDCHDDDLIIDVVLTEEGKAFLSLKTYNPIATGAPEKITITQELLPSWIKDIVDSLN